MVEHHNEVGTITVKDWLQCVSEVQQVASGIMSIGMAIQSLYDTISFEYNVYKVIVCLNIFNKGSWEFFIYYKTCTGICFSSYK